VGDSIPDRQCDRKKTGAGWSGIINRNWGSYRGKTGEK